MPIYRLIPSSYTTGSTTVSVSNASNMYANTDSDNYATITHTSANTNSIYLYLNGFNFSSVPSSASVESFSVKLKARSTGVSTSSNYRPVLVNGTTTIGGSAETAIVSGTTPTTITFSGVGSWSTIKSYGNNFGIRINNRRSNRNTQGYVYVYGAEIEVFVPEYFNISITNTSTATTNPSTTQSVKEGTDYTITFNTDSIASITVKDNNVTVDSSIVYDGNGTYKYTITNVQEAHTITVSNYSGTLYNINASSTYTGATVTPLSQQVRAGSAGSINIEVGDTYEIVVKDNGTVVTPSEPLPSTETSFIPSSFIDSESHYSAINATYDTSSGLTNSASTTYCMASAVTSTYSESYLTYAFDCSSIPENAIIDNVTCGVKGRTSSATYLPTCHAQLYSGSVAKGDQSGNFGTTATALSFDGGSWTRNELSSARVRLTAIRGNSTNAANFRFYGATLLVEYHVPAIYTISNVQSSHTITIEENTNYNVVASSNYTGATVTPATQKVYVGRSADVTISVSNLYEIVVTDNNVDVTSSLVSSGGNYVYSLSNVQSGHTILVTEQEKYGVTASSSYSGVTVEPATQQLYPGLSTTLTFRGDVLNANVRDNGVDISSSLVEHSNEQRSETLHPASLYSSTTAVTNATNACTNSTSTTYARMPIGQRVESLLIYSFDTSSIPNDATIDSVACVVKAAIGSSNNITTKDIQLYNGTSPKGSIVNIPTTSGGGTVTLSPGTWTRQELENIRIRFDAYYNGTSSNYNIDFYGADLTIGYTVNDTYYTYQISNISADHTITVSQDSTYMKVSGSWVEMVKVYKKMNNVWVEQEDVISWFDNDKIYTRNN